ncbi:MAG: enoyl-CoA hydratase/isomerase family protein [Candidatus Brocadiae bacterium]|nr:enoyl-CoA hydratase/isomerase family protein [Candidatus Brocadiia bacterium]
MSTAVEPNVFHGFVHIEKKEKYAIISIDRPGVLNAINRDVLLGLSKALDALSQDSSISCVILTGKGKAFVAGADIKEMMDFTATQAKEFSAMGQAVFSRIEQFSVPVIAAIHGFALGGGYELALACDIRIASQKAKVGQPEVNLGVTPGFGATQRLLRLVGPSKAKYLLFTGEILNAEKALHFGLVDEVVEEEKLLARCEEIALMISQKGPMAVSFCKQAVEKGMQTSLAVGLEIENNLFGLSFSTQDQKEGMRAFLEKRNPVFQKK